MAEFFGSRSHETMSFAEKLEVIYEIRSDLVPTPAKMVNRTTTQLRRLFSEEEKFLESGTVTTETSRILECK